MNLGDLNETVVILQPTVTGRSPTGEDIVTWSTLDTWEVNVEFLTGAERLGVSDAPTGVNAYRITGRNREDVDIAMRIRRGQSLLEIAAVPPMPRSMWSIVLCREVPRG